MISFLNDYSLACIPEVLKAIEQTNLEGNPGYSLDYHSKHAGELIRDKIDCQSADVQILMGGTQANLIAFAAFLRPHEAAIAVNTGHICVHETGAPESTGHKIIEVAGLDGKITPQDIINVCEPDGWSSAGILCVKPKMVYISQTTEVGTVYSRDELKALRDICDKYDLYLYCDGARLGSALACSDVTFKDLAKYCDAFYIGGTKNGALFGEAMVIVNESLQPEFRYIAKQNGGMLAKGWLLGVQFETLMQNNLYEDCGKIATDRAMILKRGLDSLGLKSTVNSPSNQQFYIFNNEVLNKLKSDYLWEVIKTVDDSNTEIRLVTSWATSEDDCNSFIKSVKEVLNAK